MKTDSYPAWFYGPNGQAQIFQSDDEVPAGWQDHPSKVITPEKTGSKPLPPKVDKVPAEQRGAAPVTAKSNATATETGGAAASGANDDKSNTLDAAGWPWDASLHAATQTKTGGGLWRMRVGIARPAPKEGFPKPAQPLDL